MKIVLYTLGALAIVALISFAIIHGKENASVRHEAQAKQEINSAIRH